MDLDTPENRKILIVDRHFSELAYDASFSIQSPCTEEYNCIAWAMGFNDRWVDCRDEDYIHKKWWPQEVTKDREPESLVKAFESLGFETCGNGKCESGYDKVALYCAPDPNDQLVWTHAARILNDNLYHSKIGGLFDIYHSAGNVFEKTEYGKVYQFMRRNVENRVITERIMRIPVISPNDEDKERIARLILSFYN